MLKKSKYLVNQGLGVVSQELNLIRIVRQEEGEYLRVHQSIVHHNLLEAVRVHLRVRLILHFQVEVIMNRK